MKILYVADGRSPIALNWMSYFIREGHEVHLASTFPCPAIEGVSSLEIIPVAMSGLYGSENGTGGWKGDLDSQASTRADSHPVQAICGSILLPRVIYEIATDDRTDPT